MDFYEKYGFTTPAEKLLANVLLYYVKRDLSKAEAINALEMIAADCPTDSEDYAQIMHMVEVVSKHTRGEV